MRRFRRRSLGGLVLLAAVVSACPAAAGAAEAAAKPCDPRVLANPLVNFDKILFAKRYKFQSNHYYTDYLNGCAKFGGSLCILSLKDGRVTDVVGSMNKGIYGRFDLSFDAKRVVFAWKKSYAEGFRLWEVGVDGSGLRQITFPPDNEAALIKKYKLSRNYHHGTDDMDPCYLPDGGICFISTRCQYGILCNGPDDFTTTVLYRIDGDGKNMEKLTNSSVSEATPAVANDGRIIYTRWEYVDKGAVSAKCIWAMRLDGTGSVEVYGNDISLPPTLTQARSIPGSNTKFVIMGVPHYPQNGVGTVIRLDMTKNIRTREPMTYITPDVDIRREGGFWHDRNGKWGPYRLFKDPWPLSDKLFLASMGTDRNWKHPTKWDLVLLSEGGDTLGIYSDPAIGCFQPVPLRPRPKPAVLKADLDPKLAAKGLAVCGVTNVYHGMEDIKPGEARYIRINEQVPRPWGARRFWRGDTYDQQHACVSKDTHLALKVQHGIVPIEPDGSAHFVVPADANVFFQVLDANYMEIQRERTYVNYRPGESRTCIGCHEMPNDAPAARAKAPTALKRAPSVPGPQPGEKTGARVLHYAADVQPVLDSHCIKCHSGDKPKASLDLTGAQTALFSRSFENIVPERRRGKGRSRRKFALIGPTVGENHPKTGNVHYLPAKSMGSHTSVLVAMLTRNMVALKDPKQAAIAARLRKQHLVTNKVKLSEADRIRLTTWADSNAQYYGSYYGRRNIRHKDHPNYRPVPSFASARSTTAPLPEPKR